MNNSPTLNTLRSVFFDQAEDLFVLFDQHLNIIDANESALRNFGFSRDEFVGKNLADVSPDVREKGRYKLYLEVIESGEPLILDQVIHHPSMRGICNRIKVFKVGDGMGGVLTNITDLKNALDELDTFVYRSSHDMRSPLASIIGLSDLAIGDIVDLETARYYFKLIKQQAQRLDKTLHKLIETTNIRRLNKNSEPVNFNELIDSIVSQIIAPELLEDIHFERIVSVRSAFHSDQMLLSTMIENLLDNALKFRNATTKAHFVKLTIDVDDRHAQIVVSDNGIGIPEKFHKDVFKMFFRANNKVHGSGLGLYSVEQCVKKLGGHLQLESKESEGTTFTVFVPNN